VGTLSDVSVSWAHTHWCACSVMTDLLALVNDANNAMMLCGGPFHGDGEWGMIRQMIIQFWQQQTVQSRFCFSWIIKWDHFIAVQL